MAFIRIKTVKGTNYYYLVESKREDGKVRQNILKYFGTTVPDGYVVPTEKRHAVVAKEATKKVSSTRTIGKVEAKVVSTTDKIPVSTTVTPLDIQIVLQRRAADNHIPVEDYLRKLLDILPDGTRRKHRKKLETC